MEHKKKNTITTELRPFFYPRSIAVAGVSRDHTRYGSAIFKTIRDFGFSGQLYPVNPKLDEYEGIKAYPSITAIPEVVDLVYITTTASQVPAIVRECRAKGVPAVIIISAGFSEAGTCEGRKLESDIKQYTGNGMHIIGPNCFGIYSPDGGVTQLSSAHFQKISGHVGIISQSGGLLDDICRVSRDYDIRLSKVVSYGNACDITEAELLRYFEEDDQTRIIAAYIEGARKGKETFEILKRLSLVKPVIILKGGLTPRGAIMVSSHTASLGGSEQIWDALFRQTGTIRVDSVEELLDTITAFSHLPPQIDNRISLICGGGGVSVMATDASYRAGLEIAPLSKGLRRKIAALLPPVGSSANNPIDVANPFPPAEVIRDIIEYLAASGEVRSIILDKLTLSCKLRQLFGYTKQISWKEKSWLKDIPVLMAKKWNIPVVVILREGGDVPGKLSCEAETRKLRAYYRNNNVAVYPNIERALKALGKMIAYYRWLNDITKST